MQCDRVAVRIAEDPDEAEFCDCLCISDDDELIEFNAVVQKQLAAMAVKYDDIKRRAMEREDDEREAVVRDVG
jgi:hypothetical protein